MPFPRHTPCHPAALSLLTQPLRKAAPAQGCHSTLQQLVSPCHWPVPAPEPFVNNHTELSRPLRQLSDLWSGATSTALKTDQATSLCLDGLGDLGQAEPLPPAPLPLLPRPNHSCHLQDTPPGSPHYLLTSSLSASSLTWGLGWGSPPSTSTRLPDRGDSVGVRITFALIKITTKHGPWALCPASTPGATAGTVSFSQLTRGTKQAPELGACHRLFEDLSPAGRLRP